MRRILCSLVFFIFTCAEAGTLVSIENGQCTAWSENKQSSESISWSGQCIGGKASGQGVMQWFHDGVAGRRYEGEYKNGKQNGKGTLTYPDGTNSVGRFEEDQPHGFVTITFMKSNRNLAYWEGKGSWVSDKYVVQGLFESGQIVLQCPNESSCLKQQAKNREQQARDAREAAARWEKEAPTRRICEAQKQTCLAQCQGVASCGGGSAECGRLVSCQSSCRDINCN